MHIVAQKNQHLIVGTIKESDTIIRNAHIINLTTKQGTFSNDIGKYRIYVSLGDSLKISSVQYLTEYRVVSKFDIESETIDVYMIPKTHELDEIILKKHNLTGNLLKDLKKSPKDLNNKFGNSMNGLIMGFSIKDIMEFPVGNDEMHLKKPGTSGSPLKGEGFKGIGGSTSIGSGNKKKLKIEKITSSTFTSKTVLDEIGKGFFIDIGIKEKDIYSFLDFCKKFNIEGLYKQKRILQLLTLLKEKSILYLKEFKQE
tara:strand:+ start:44197 stop:44964 length:768 start_codon:yes stop_codon:yes gene_type:complete